MDERLFKAQTEAIKSVAEKGYCVIVGRNANIVLQEYDRTLHVFISATEHFRMKCMQNKLPEMSEEKLLEKFILLIESGISIVSIIQIQNLVMLHIMIYV